MTITEVRIHSELNHELDNQDQQCLSSVLQSFDDDRKRVIQRAVDGKTSVWLTVMPVAHHHLDLSSVEFQDALALRYHHPLLNMPAFCDGCGSQSSMEHALDCRIGGLVIQQHNELRDALGDLASIVYKEVIREPIVREADDKNNVPALIADLGVRGCWQPKVVTLFYV